MQTTEVTDGIYCLTANIGCDILFEGIWPLPQGASMNSYVVKGKDVAIVDGVCAGGGEPKLFFAELEKLGVKVEDVRYVVVNHTEPDHSGWLKALAERNKKFEMVITAKGAEMAKGFYGLEDISTRVVKSGDSLDLGNGKQLIFQEIPNVHWPDTMVSFEPSTGTLLCCDAFGTFGALEDKIYDDQLGEEQLQAYEEEGLRYYANIVAKFSMAVNKAIDKVKALDVRIVAPGHGPIWRSDPQRIVRLYEWFAAYAKGPAKPQVTVLWSTMYGNTGRTVEPLVEGITSEGVEAVVYQVPQTHISEILASAWESTGIALAMPTYEFQMFPPMATIIDELGRKTVKNKLALRVGSFSWSGGAQRELDEIMERRKMGWQFLEPVEFQGAPGEEDLELVRQRGRELARKVKEAALAELPA